MSLEIDRFSHIESSVQRWDPRIKILSLGFFIFVAALLKTIPVAVISLLIAIIIIKITNIPFHFVAQSIKWIIIFLAPFFFILPFSYPGEAAFRFIGLPFAWEGFRLAVLIFTKAVAIVLATDAVFGSSRFDISMIAMQRLKCPKVIVQMVLFTYRYIFVFIDEVKRMEKAMRSKGFVMKANMNTLRTMGNFVGTLLIRSFERTGRVYSAMLSKGYQGDLHTLVTFEAQVKDFVKAGLIAILTIAVFVTDMINIFHPAIKGWY
ncbi:MAG: cobalt ECF transporter T component CbiQ [Nitrospirae bacterium]|nr:cobalt ECF transporter T component CbiQ [Nitrospirota bacterium]